MTYIEKLMSGIKFDRAVISEQEEKRIREHIAAHPHTLFCPGHVFVGAPLPGKRTCGFNSCAKCWKSKAPEARQ